MTKAKSLLQKVSKLMDAATPEERSEVVAHYIDDISVTKLIQALQEHDIDTEIVIGSKKPAGSTWRLPSPELLTALSVDELHELITLCSKQLTVVPGRAVLFFSVDTESTTFFFQGGNTALLGICQYVEAFSQKMRTGWADANLYLDFPPNSQ